MKPRPEVFEFNAAEVAAQLRDSLDAEWRRATMGQATEMFMAEGLSEDDAIDKAMHDERRGPDVAPGLWLVRDEGVYLMSNGPYRPDRGVAYTTNEGAAEAGRRLFNGDDFGEYIPAVVFNLDELESASRIRLTVAVDGPELLVAAQCQAA